jgi:hypothetical protein
MVFIAPVENRVIDIKIPLGGDRMALAHVVYQISTDADFADRMRANPEKALEERGWHLSKEELSFLLASLTRRALGKDDLLVMATPKRRWW